MTAEDLKKRGYCCGHGCVNCPYLPRHQYGNTVLADTYVEESKFEQLCRAILEKNKSN